MEKAIEAFADRYAAILAVYGLSPSDLSETLDEPIAKFYKYKDGVKPRREVLEKMLLKLPRLSPDFLYRGIGPVQLSMAQKTASLSEADEAAANIEAVILRQELDRIRIERDFYKEILEKRDLRIEKLETQLDTANQTMADLAKTNFPESNSQTTAYPMYNQFERVVIEGFRPAPKATQELAGPLDILSTIGCEQDADGVWGVPFTPMDIVVRT